MENKNQIYIPAISKRHMAISIALAPLFLTAYALMREYVDIEWAFSAAATIFMYLLSVSLVSFYYTQKMKKIPVARINGFLNESSTSFFKNTTLPIFLLDSYGTILWYNDSMNQILEAHGSFIESNVSTLFGTLTQENFEGTPVSLFDKLYKIESFKLANTDDEIFLAMLYDVTEYADIKKRYHDERTAIAYIAIDNVEDVLQYVHEKFRDAVSSVDDKIKAWAASMNGVVKSYDNDKYIMIFDSSKLDECISNRFEILDHIRDSRVGDGVSITASIGISRGQGTLAEREAVAKEAIDMALQRGGDQVVYISDDSIEYYGGRTKSLYKRSNVKSRTFTNQLCATIARSDNVIIMGHKYGDFDSFGASIGIARIAMIMGIKVNIAVDIYDKNLLPLIELMQKSENYSRVFVDSAEAFELISPDTVVILVDHNTFERSQFSDISKRVRNVVMIDHHRKGDVMPETVSLSYIEPSASSTCELVSEMLEVALNSQNLLKEEADMILSGILLDTKQFTRNTGTRTFGAAQYLRGAGANPSDVYDLFKTSPMDLAKESRFHTSITVYKDNIAIASCDGDTDESYRIIASKAADKMLTLKDVDAAFAMVRIGEQIHISGRSNGKINVQIILEKLNGGGHFDIAGAQVTSESTIEVLEKLKESIDSYLDSMEKAL